MTKTRGWLLIAVLAGCGKPSLEAVCQKQAQVTCRRGFECARGFFEAFYGTEQNCLTTSYRSCESLRDTVCDDLTALERCIAATQQATCSTTNVPECNGNLLANANCRNVNGRASCSSSNVNTSGNSCTVTLSQCSDNRVYTLACSGNSCQCNDGSSQRSVNGSCSSKEAAIALCGWNVQ